jgi:5-(carboxyamino)imidazole ribonucleotide synthase
MSIVIPPGSVIGVLGSGHLTIDARVAGQFEQPVRAVCGLPLASTELASTEQLLPAAMADLMGDLWEAGPPLWH